jgi:hypothetical protein
MLNSSGVRHQASARNDRRTAQAALFVGERIEYQVEIKAGNPDYESVTIPSMKAAKFGQARRMDTAWPPTGPIRRRREDRGGATKLNISRRQRPMNKNPIMVWLSKPV